MSQCALQEAAVTRLQQRNEMRNGTRGRQPVSQARNETCKFLTNAITFTGRGKKAPHKDSSFMLKTLFFRPFREQFSLHTAGKDKCSGETGCLSEPGLLRGQTEW